MVDPLLAALTSLRGQDLTNKVYLVAPDGLHVVWVWSKAKQVDTKVSQVAGTEELENLSNYTEVREQDTQSHQNEAEGVRFSFEQLQQKVEREISVVSVHTRWCSTAYRKALEQGQDAIESWIMVAELGRPIPSPNKVAA